MNADYPLPWKLDEDGGDTYIRDAKGKAVACDTTYYPWIETEAMPGIVHAVNCHAQLLEALKAFVTAERDWLHERAGMPKGTFDDPLGDALKLAEAAILKAEGRT